jgi:hypothetical protein
VTYEAGLYRAAAGSKRPSGKAIFTASGSMKKLYLTWVVFPRRALPPGRYVFQVVLRSAESVSRTVRIVSPALVVNPKP